MSAPALAAATEPDPPGYFIQLGAFRIAANAKNLQAAALRQGFKAVIVPFSRGRTDWLIVRVPGFNTRASAELTAAQFPQNLRVGSIVMRDPG